MRVIVNGECKDVAAGTLNALIDELDYATARVAVAINHVVVPRARWSATALNSGDEIEIITPRQGG
jgi:sulfur carrier protein